MHGQQNVKIHNFCNGLSLWFLVLGAKIPSYAAAYE